MRLHTGQFKREIKEFPKQIDNRITYGNNIISGEQLSSINPILKTDILKSVMKGLLFESSIQVPLKTVINFEFGLIINGEYEWLNYGNYIVKSIEYNEDTKTYEHMCCDSMLFSMKDYEHLQHGTFPMTVREYLTNLCLDLGLVFKDTNSNFANYNQIIETDLYANLGYTYRDIFDELAQVTASNICIDINNMVEIRYLNDTNDTINEEYLKDVNVKFGQKYGPINSIVLSRSAESDNVYLRDEQSVTENGLCEIKIIDNQIMNNNNRSDYLGAILQKLNGIQYYINDFSSTGIMYYEVCDKYNIQIGENTYNCVLFNDEPKITSGLIENIYTDMPKASETDYTKSDKTDRKINEAYLIVDKQNQTIQSVVSNVTEQNQKIAQVTQTVEELNSQIKDIADITTSAEDTDARVELNDINQSEPIRVVIRPIGENISYVYPSSSLYPSEDLFMKTRTLRFHNTTTGEYFDYELPTDLLYYDVDNYDEFILDYDGQSCVVNKKVGYNADGTTYVLDNPSTVSYEYPEIVLSNGDYEVYLPGYSNAYLFVRLMAENIYTTQFATRAEMNNEIKQSATETLATVSANYGTKEDISQLSQRADSISATVSTKAGEDELQSSVTILNNKIESKVSNDTFNSEITQLDKEIALKVDDKNYTHAEIVAKINDNTSIAKINGDKIELSANDILNLLAGNTINLTSKNINISATNFSVDANGNVTAINLKATNGEFSGVINSSTIKSSRLKGTDDNSIYVEIGTDSNDGVLPTNNSFQIKRPDGTKMLSIGGRYWSSPSTKQLVFYTPASFLTLSNDDSTYGVHFTAGTVEATYKMRAPEYVNTSLVSLKKNIEKFDDGIELIKNTDVYTYHYKTQKDTEKKHVGLVIGDNYKSPIEMLDSEQTGVNLYAMNSITLDAVKKLIDRVETLENKIKELESDK